MADGFPEVALCQGAVGERPEDSTVRERARALHLVHDVVGMGGHQRLLELQRPVVRRRGILMPAGLNPQGFAKPVVCGPQ